MGQTNRSPLSVEALPREVRDTLEAAELLYEAVAEHAPTVLLHDEVKERWKRLGESLAWLRR